jgi:glycosyltransferase involved in cell wall biosynthesis
MRIAILPSADLSYESGSVIHALRLVNYLLSRNHDVIVLASKLPQRGTIKKKNSIRLNKRLLPHPVITDRLVSNREYLSTFKIYFSFIVRLHAEKAIDVIHCSYMSTAMAAAISFGAIACVPVVVSSFGRELTIGMDNDIRIKRMIYLGLQNVTRIIAPDESVKARLEELRALVHSNTSIDVIPPPVDSRVLETKGKWSRAAIPTVSLICSAFTPEKGIDCVLGAMGVLVRSGIELKLIVAGSDDHPLKANEKRVYDIVEQTGLKPYVSFPGFLNREGISHLLQTTHIFVDARLKGNFSSSVLEAQFIGVPTIASDLPFSKAIITPGVNGELFPANDVCALSGLIKALLRDDGYKRRLIRGCEAWSDRHRVNFSEEGCMAQIEDIYRDCVAGNRRS